MGVVAEFGKSRQVSLCISGMYKIILLSLILFYNTIDLGPVVQELVSPSVS